MKVILIIGVMIILLIAACVLLMLTIAIKIDDVEKIENIDGYIICSETNQLCIKDVLYTKCNDCNGCQYENIN